MIEDDMECLFRQTPCMGGGNPMQYWGYGPMMQPYSPGYPPYAPMPAIPTTPIEPLGTGTGTADFINQPGAPVEQDIAYTQGYLRENIGKKVRVEFLIGTNMLTDRVGTLVEVGISYIVIIPAETDDLLMCDIYSIKFVTIYK